MKSQAATSNNEDDENKDDTNQAAPIGQKYSRQKPQLVPSNNTAVASEEDDMIDID